MTASMLMSAMCQALAFALRRPLGDRGDWSPWSLDEVSKVLGNSV